MDDFGRAQAGDSDALAMLLRRHMPLVQALSRRFSYSEDAFQQGCIGLLLAIRRYRSDSGFQFSTYAVPVILGEMRRAFSQALGWRARRTLRAAEKIRQDMIRLTGREPAAADVARAAGIAPEELMLLMERSRPPLYDDESCFLMQCLPDPSSDAWLLRLLIRDILDRMQRDESLLLRRRFLLGYSQAAVARALRITQSAASRREKAARMHFRAAWEDEG